MASSSSQGPAESDELEAHVGDEFEDHVGDGGDPEPPGGDHEHKGPETFEETLEAHRFFVGRLKGIFAGADAAVWKDMKERGVVFTSDYRGCGSAEGLSLIHI